MSDENMGRESRLLLKKECMNILQHLCMDEDYQKSDIMFSDPWKNRYLGILFATGFQMLKITSFVF